MLRELAWHHARGSLLRFLEDPSVSPTNNTAERALRPAVIARKLSAGSKSERGALAFSSFKSVIETGKLSGVSGFKTLLGVYEDKR
jgi:transposase